MTEQPVARKLAEVIDAFNEADESLPLEMLPRISTELQRLHELNAELLAEFKEIVSDYEFCDKEAGYGPRAFAYYETAKRMIEKAQGETE